MIALCDTEVRGRSLMLRVENLWRNQFSYVLIPFLRASRTRQVHEDALSRSSFRYLQRIRFYRSIGPYIHVSFDHISCGVLSIAESGFEYTIPIFWQHCFLRMIVNLALSIDAESCLTRSRLRVAWQQCLTHGKLSRSSIGQDKNYKWNPVTHWSHCFSLSAGLEI